MGFAKKWQHMVLAERIERYILDNYHLAVVFFEQCATQDLLGILLVALGEELHSFAHTCRGLQEAFTLVVLAYELEDLLDMVRYLLGSIIRRNKRRCHNLCLLKDSHFVGYDIRAGL